MSCCRARRRTGTWVWHPEAGDGRASRGTGTKVGLMPSRDGHHNLSCCLKNRQTRLQQLITIHPALVHLLQRKPLLQAGWNPSKGCGRTKIPSPSDGLYTPRGKADAQEGFASPGEAPLDISNDEEQSSCSASLQSI